jgi:raffinose/stachyose/melibiose transport system permease protein
MFEARRPWHRVTLQVVVTLLVLPYLFPLIVMVQGSLAGKRWGNYRAVLDVPGFWRFFLNSALIAAGVILLVYAVTMLAAYGFAKLHIHGREIFFWLLLACLTLPEVVLLAPLFATDTKLGLYNTYWAVILPLAALQVPFAVLLTRNFLNGLPNELFEAIRVDGASPVGVFRHLVLPLTRPIAAAVIIFTLIGAWNDYLMPLVFLQSTSLQTITLVPQYFVGEFSNDQTKILASAVLTAIPEIVAYSPCNACLSAASPPAPSSKTARVQGVPSCH